MKKWEIVKEYKGDLIDILLENRGVVTKKEKNVFLKPPDPATLTSKDVAIDKVSITKAIKRIQKAIKDKDKQIVQINKSIPKKERKAFLKGSAIGLAVAVLVTLFR